MDWTQWAANLVTTLIASGVIGAIAWRYWNRVDGKVDQQEDEINRLKNQNLADLSASIDKLEKKIEVHIEKDQSQRIVAMLEAQGGTLNQLNAKFDRQSELTAKQEARLNGLDLYIGNLDKSFENHKTLFHTNSGRKLS